MNTLVVLATVLFILMTLIGGKRGIRAFFALFLNMLVVFIMLLFMVNPSFHPLLITVIATVFIVQINLYYINGKNEKTIAAFRATMTTVLLLLGFITLVSSFGMIQGFSEEESAELIALSPFVGLDFIQIAAGVMMLSALGAMTDVSISVSTAMYEMYVHDPGIDRKRLFQSGMTIGRDILGTDTNTLFFAFFGGYLALLIWFKDLHYTFGEMINSKVFSAEIVTIFSAGIGIALVIPMTAGWTIIQLKKNKRSE